MVRWVIKSAMVVNKGGTLSFMTEVIALKIISASHYWWF